MCSHRHFIGNGKRIEYVAEIRGYIKARCKLGLSVKSMQDEICVIYGDKQMSFSTVYKWFYKNQFRSGIKVALVLEDPGLQLSNLTLIKSSPL